MSRPRYAPGSTVRLAVKNRSGKKPLASYLASRLGVVEPWAEDLLRRGCILLDGLPAEVDSLINLSAGPHQLEVRFPEIWPRHMAATSMPLEILHEDGAVVALDKPPGIVVHPARGHLDNQTLQNGVLHRYRHLQAGAGVCIAPPHRLDKDTSGVILFALTRTAYVDLVAQFSNRLPRKIYYAVVDGDPGFRTMRCDSPIGPDPATKGKGAIIPPHEGGKAAVTDFLVLEKGRGWALVRAIPLTGRPHQIRVHAASLGLPLAGDREYNPRFDRLGFGRQALHAHALSFRHPVTAEDMTVQAAMPGDMAQALERLRQGEKAS